MISYHKCKHCGEPIYRNNGLVNYSIWEWTHKRNYGYWICCDDGKWKNLAEPIVKSNHFQNLYDKLSST